MAMQVVHVVHVLLDRIGFLRNVDGGTFLRVECCSYVPILFPLFKSPLVDCIIDGSYCPLDSMLD